MSLRSLGAHVLGGCCPGTGAIHQNAEDIWKGVLIWWQLVFIYFKSHLQDETKSPVIMCSFDDHLKERSFKLF